MDEYAASQLSTQNSQNPLEGAVFMVIYLVIFVLFLVSAWKVYAKAGKPGWTALIPFYNLYVLLQIVGRPGWWLLLYFIPVVNLAVSLMNAMDLAKVFGKSSLFGVGLLWLFSFIGYPILAFGKSTYKGESKLTPTKPSTPPVATPPTSATLPAA